MITYQVYSDAYATWLGQILGQMLHIRVRRDGTKYVQVEKVFDRRVKK